MKGKYARKKPRNKSPMLWVAILLLAAALAVVAWLVFGPENAQKQPIETYAAPTETADAEIQNETQAAEVQNTENTGTGAPTPTETVGTPTSFDLDNGLKVTGFGDYTGLYMEDGSNEIVSGVMMILVTNNSEFPLQYAEITLSGEMGDAHFNLSTLNPGQTAVVLEANRKAYTSGDSYTEASSSKVVFFDEQLSTHADILKIQPLDGGFNITNISDEDITGDITVYYKNYAGDMLYGGITYRGTVSGGLGAGQIKQIMSSTFTESGTVVMFVTISES